jgi:hypothetical protein
VLQGLGQGLIGLALQGLMEQLRAQGAAQLHDQFLKLGEASAPRKPLGAVEVVQQVFGRRLQHRTQRGRNFYISSLYCHLELLSAVARQVDRGLACPILRASRPARKPCRAPCEVRGGTKRR